MRLGYGSDGGVRVSASSHTSPAGLHKLFITACRGACPAPTWALPAVCGSRSQCFYDTCQERSSDSLGLFCLTGLPLPCPSFRGCFCRHPLLFLGYRQEAQELAALSVLGSQLDSLLLSLFSFFCSFVSVQHQAFPWV